MRLHDDACQWCGSDLVWRGSIMDGELVCPFCDSSESVDDFDDAQESGACPECGAHTIVTSGAYTGALVCQNAACDVVAFKSNKVFSRRGKAKP